METLFNIFLVALMIGGTFTTLLGTLTVVYWMKPSNAPADESNRIGAISSWWIGLTRRDVIATSYKYYRQDVLDNMQDVEK